VAWALGDEKARHGGLVQMSGEVKFGLVANGVQLAKGDRVIALVTLADKTTSSARFVIK